MISGTKTLPLKPHAAASSVAMLTVLSTLSPFSGLLVEMMLAWRYGASGTVDAFRIASLIIVLGNQLFFSYVLPHIVVPMFAEYRAKHSVTDGWWLIQSIAMILSIFTLLFVIWVWYTPLTLVNLLGPGLTDSGQSDASLFVRCFSLVFLLMVFSGVASGVLQAYRVFWLTAIAQLIPNMFVIVSIFFIGNKTGGNALALGTLLGYTVMFCLYIYSLLNIKMKAGIRIIECLTPGPQDGLKKAFRLSIPLITTIFIGQWGIVIINRALSGMPVGSLAEFGYAWKLLTMISLIPTGLATVIFPSFADAQANNNREEFSRLVTRAVRMTLLLTIPLATALFVERTPIINLVFGSGRMSGSELTETAQLFGILLIGAPASALAASLNKVSFSIQDTKTPTVIALISTLAIAILVPYSSKLDKAFGIAWVLSSITLVSTLLMLGYQIYSYRIMKVWDMLYYVMALITLSIVAVLPVYAIRSMFDVYAQSSSIVAFIELFVAAIVFIYTGYLTSIKLSINESTDIWRYIKWQFLQHKVMNTFFTKQV